MGRTVRIDRVSVRLQGVHPAAGRLAVDLADALDAQLRSRLPGSRERRALARACAEATGDRVKAALEK